MKKLDKGRRSLSYQNVYSEEIAALRHPPAAGPSQTLLLFVASSYFNFIANF